MTKSVFSKIFLSLLLILSAVFPYMAQADAAEPITVADAIANNTGTATVKGYIVGTANSGTSYDQEAPFTSATNVGWQIHRMKQTRRRFCQSSCHRALSVQE
nr:DUF6359 domain-containing protein [Planococcus glaciei]